MKFKTRDHMAILQTELELDRVRQENTLLQAQVKALACRCEKQKKKRSLLEDLYDDLLEKIQKGLK
jgi:hypothetical protein